jgi:hypothetical protein
MGTGRGGRWADGHAVQGLEPTELRTRADLVGSRAALHRETRLTTWAC